MTHWMGERGWQAAWTRLATEEQYHTLEDIFRAGWQGARDTVEQSLGEWNDTGSEAEVALRVALADLDA